MDWRQYQKQQKVVELNKGFISYAEFGNESSIPVIFLHGMPTWGYVFQGLIPGLQERKIYIPDLMGFGFSSKTDSFDRSLEAQTEYILEFMERLNIPRATFVGHELGGGIALRLACHYPQTVSRVCLFNSICYDNWPLELLTNVNLKNFYHFIGVKNKKLLTSLIAPYLTETSQRSLERNASSLNTNSTLSLTRLFRKITVPLKIIWGKDDPYLRFTYAKRLLMDIPQAQLIDLHASSHMVMIDRESECIQELNNFLFDKVSDLYSENIQK